MNFGTRTECLDFVHGFAKSQMLFSAVELGVFEELEKNDNLCASDVAKQIETDEDATERLLNACVSIGFLSKNDKGKFSNTEKARWCLKSTKGSLYGDILVNKHSCYYSYGCLTKTIKTGKNCAADVFGVDGDKLYTFGGGYYKDKTSTENFVQGMDGCSFGVAEEALKCFDLSKYRTVCDLGGGSGVFCLALRQMYPNMNIILFDLPEVIEVNKKNSDIIRAVELVAGLEWSNGVKLPIKEYFRFIEAVSSWMVGETGIPAPQSFIYSGDFFKDPLPEADFYMLNHILEDWSEENINRLLKKVYNFLPKGGALLLCEYCLPPNKVADTFAHVVDLNQLASCEGKMRTVDEWKTLLVNAAKFSKVQRNGTSSYFGDVIIATK